MKATGTRTVQAHVAWVLRGTIYDMDHVLEDLLKGEKFYFTIGVQRKQLTVKGVMNQGFNGQVVFCSYRDGRNTAYRHIAVEKLPAAFQAKMIKKYDAK